MERKALLLLPGLLCDASLFTHQAGALADAVDIGVGDLSLADSIATMADEVLARAPAQPFVLLGMSMGGYVAFEILRRAPKRVQALVLLNTSARPDTAEASETRRRLVRRAQGNFPLVVELLARRMAFGGHANTPEVGGAFQAMAASLGVEVFARQEQAIIERPDSRPLLPSIRCPTLVIGGLDDQVTPPALQREMARAIPQADLELIEACGHLSPLEQPERVTAILRDWLASLPG